MSTTAEAAPAAPEAGGETSKEPKTPKRPASSATKQPKVPKAKKPKKDPKTGDKAAKLDENGQEKPKKPRGRAAAKIKREAAAREAAEKAAAEKEAEEEARRKGILSPQRVEQVVRFTIHANAFLHSVQAERGVSCCFVSGTGGVLVDLLRDVRKDTDEAQNKLRQCEIYEEVASSFNREQTLREFRQKVDFMQFPYLEILTSYNMLSDGIIEAIHQLVKPLAQLNLGMALGSYSSFLYLKDMVGRERAAVGAILSDKRRNGVLSPMGHLVLVANLGAQKAFARSFTSTCVSDTIRTMFLQSYRDCPEEVVELERNLMVSFEATSQNLSMLTPEIWIQKMTIRMNGLNELQRHLAQHMLDLTRTYCGKGPKGENSANNSVEVAGELDLDDGAAMLEALSKLDDEELVLPTDWPHRMAGDTQQAGQQPGPQIGQPLDQLPDDLPSLQLGHPLGVLPSGGSMTSAGQGLSLASLLAQN